MREQQCDYVLKTASERGVRMVRLWFTDVLGNLKSFAISQNELENALNDGMTFDGSSIDGFSRVQESDVLAIPDPDTFQILPFGDKDAAEARVFCDIHHLDGSAFTGDPRQVLRRHVEAARGEGLTFYIAPDIEFFYFTPPQPGERPTPLDFGGYFDLTTRDVTGDLRKQTIRTLEQIGIPVEYSFHEDSPSQQEIDLRHDDALTIADSVMTFRHVVREVAAAHGVYATFMPKPLEGVQGSGMHTHLSLFTGDENAFYDEADEYNLSPLAKSFMAGLLQHAAEITAITNPTVNRTNDSCRDSKPRCTSVGHVTTGQASLSCPSLNGVIRLRPDSNTVRLIRVVTPTLPSASCLPPDSRGCERVTSFQPRPMQTCSNSMIRRSANWELANCPSHFLRHFT